MGTDIYLHWDNQNDVEKDKQITGYSIGHGYTGYLRASIGMTQENQLLRMIFPDQYWQHEIPEADKCEYCQGDGWNETRKEECGECNGSGNKDGVSGLRYQFNASTWMSLALGTRLYLAHAIMGSNMPEEDIPNSKMLEAILHAVSSDDTEVEVSDMNSPEDFFSKITWLKSLVDFFYLGAEKEKKGLNPKVYISW